MLLDIMSVLKKTKQILFYDSPELLLADLHDSETGHLLPQSGEE